MDNGVRIPSASDGAMTNGGPQPNGHRRVVVKTEDPATASPSATPNGPKNGPKDESESRSASPDDNVTSDDATPGDAKPSPSGSISTPDTSAAPPKLNRKASSLQRASGAAAPSGSASRVLFSHVPDATAEATSQFQVIADCLYGSKNMGSSDHDAFDCDCAEEWRDGQNLACGEDSDCINRATKMECVESECNCGEGCQNQRFQRKQYARVSVIKTEKKGFGLRADADLQPNDFIFEYIGEVINEPAFRRRMLQYDEEGIKHFYFMSLTKSEFVDATRKGNLGRFCNHSCNPNCYVDKWVVGKKLRMGIFAGRAIRAGEELVFDYNVDRYGADPQPCYCGEPNCTGFIGGKTQTERATKLSQATIEALGIDDPDSRDTAVAKKQRRKKPNEDDEDYVNSLQQTGLIEDGVTKVMAALMQCKEKWIAVKLLARIQSAGGDERVLNRVVRMHGYQILCSILTLFRDDDNVVLQVLDILYHFPRLTKNKISDSSIETVVESLATSEHEDVAAESKRLLDAWSKLQIAYRIPRKKFDPNAPASAFEERRGRDAPNATDNDDAASGSARQRAPLSPLHGIVVPKGPRSNVPQRSHNFLGNNGSNAAVRSQWKQQKNGPQGSPQGGLPSGWFSATDPTGNVYYYTKSGATTWKRPTLPADKAVPSAPKAPSKAQQDMNAVQDIINSLTKEAPRQPVLLHTPQAATTPTPEPKKEKWRSLPLEKQQKIYENTLHPHIKSVTDRFRNRLPKDEIKKFGKEISKKLVASDYKNNRVEDPNVISARQEKKVKAYVRDFFERAAAKYHEHEKKKAEREVRHPSQSNTDKATASSSNATGAGHGEDTEMSEEPMASTSPRGTHAASAAAATGSTITNGAGSHDKSDDLSGLDDMALSDDGGAPGEESGNAEAAALSPASSDRKRKRTNSATAHGVPSPSATPSETPSIKRLKDDDAADMATPPTPPPPPPPPATDEENTGFLALERKTNAAALQQREEDEEALRRENEDAMRDYEEQSKQQPQEHPGQQRSLGLSGNPSASASNAPETENGLASRPAANGTKAL